LKYECQGRTQDHIFQTGDKITAQATVTSTASGPRNEASNGDKDFLESEAAAGFKIVSNITDKQLSEQDAMQCREEDKNGSRRGCKQNDPRNMKPEELLRVIDSSEMLNGKQKGEVFKTLSKYLPSVTEKPGKCNLFKYEFNVVLGHNRVNPSRSEKAWRDICGLYLHRILSL
jgi:hypothetical protein